MRKNLRQMKIMKMKKYYRKYPKAVLKLMNLTYLDLSNNWLTEIPPEIGNLINLEYLDLSRNLLTGEIPSEIGNLINLTELN